ncbi:peptidase domain-containing ABC transporter [Paracraurococcus lichenis]|uniref:Peptidase domain-containing ABC transporter n=1 Tax=Paracraurococcus lichenis TaxID=3064888 RepID=A0ABT9DVS4_9PROT|nr:peptidase domain-containing ABC transporter [Paracraurococcus sp. LOR1-02]MDO9708001.1 peptidase domain-containing ABC transporter [Paracraurococcus sp. LOR1-02]
MGQPQGAGRGFGLRSFLPDLLQHRRLFAEAYLSALLLHVLGMVTPLFFGAVLDKVVVHHAESTLLVLTIGVVLAIGFDAAIGLVHDTLLLHANPKIDVATAARVFRHALSLPLPFFVRHQAGALVRDLQQDQAVRGFLTQGLFFSFTELAALLVLLPLLLSFSPALTAVVLAFSGLIALVSAGLSGPFRRRMDANYAAQGERQALLVETLHGIATVKALGLEANRQARWEAATATALDRARDLQWLGTRARTLTQALERLMAVAVIFTGAQLVFAGSLTIGQLVAFQMLSGRATGPLMYFISLIKSWQEAATAARQLARVMEAAPEAAGGRGLRPVLRGGLRFEGVAFAYEGSTATALEAIDLEIPAGSTLGIVGRSGSGKSTLIRLAQGLLAPTAGRILVDGHDLADLDRAHLRRAIGVVPQESFLFRGTVRENLAVAEPGASFDDIQDAAGQAGADGFIRRMPDGYDSLLEEGAVNLSGGQRQRLAIARALLRRPPILVFDEATSALDMETEAEIQRNLDVAAAGRTLVLVSHRLAAVQGMDAILVLDRGRIAGFGTHAELLRGCLAYRQLWSAQPAMAAPVMLAAE